ncbi:MAG: AAA family ATPase [Flectobacillus sp.]|uniref:AAA family ATPase n=1 Tax=Flectobacillus sp. TaxID=50419 RepID=UPI003B9AC428
MNEPIKYIKKVEIKNLWGRYDLEWNLDPSVNVLSGINGSGKSTILNAIFWGICLKDAILENIGTKVKGVTVIFNNTEKLSKQSLIEERNVELRDFDLALLKNIKIDFLNTFDSEISVYAAPNEKVKTVLDKEIFELQRQYLDYQLTIGKRVFELLAKKESSENIIKIQSTHERFLDIIDLLFEFSGKYIDRNSNELIFLSGKDRLTPYQLSSGEKQIIVILLTVLVQDNKPAILFMDEPEISLHIDWQRKLIQYIKELNPNVQIILATHSPGIILEGWADKVFEVSDLITLDRQAIPEDAK